MKILWKIATPIACAAILGGIAAGSYVYKSRVKAARLAEEVRADRLGAEQGNAEAQTKLGHLYFYGRGVPQDYAEAVRWFQKAADQGYAKGEDDVGAMYYYGNGVPQDYAQALAWYRKAAAQGAAYAQTDLGDVYYSGKAVPQDSASALLWYRKAADQGYARAQDDVAVMYYFGLSVPLDYAEAARWYRKAADQGNARGECDLGYMEYYGKGIPVNLAEGRRLIREAAVQGDKRALRAISYSLTTFFKVDLWIQLIGGLFFTLSFVRLRFKGFTAQQKPLTFREKVVGATAALILVSTGYAWYGYTHLKFRRLSYGPNTYSVVHWLLDAAVIVLLIYILRWDKEREAEVGGNGSPDDDSVSVGSTNI
jgi:TPR repeat protein